jgi:diguanylate cyclase (GGDEF)-like protein
MEGHVEKSLNILVVDDSPSFRALVMDMIGDHHKIRIAGTAAEAMEAARLSAPDLVFLDIVLPDAEGYDICPKLRLLNPNRPMQIVLMSASSDSERLNKILDSGADDFIRKPFEALEFQLRMKAAAIRLAAQEAIMEEREFYRQAVRQEEALTVKLLDRQMNLRENMVDLEQKKLGLESENKRLEAAARYDLLTGLLNRQSLEARMILETRKAKENDSSLCGLMLDIDHFKLINDSYGHVVGDEVLRVVGKELRKCLRREDYAGRYGGEEFFVILPGSLKTTARAVAERIRSSIEGTFLEARDARISVTVSIGLSEFQKSEPIIDWVEHADAAMYRAKQAGRNQVQD